LQNGLDHAIGIVENIVVPKPEHFPVLTFEPSCSVCVRCVVAVLTTIDFDRQLVLGAGEVDDETAQRMLPPKFVSRQSPMA
jgi:hypothetical protein